MALSLPEIICDRFDEALVESFGNKNMNIPLRLARYKRYRGIQ